MSIETKNELGSIKINDQVIVNFVGKVMSSFDEIITTRNIGDGVKVTTSENGVNIELAIVIKYGENITIISDKIMKKVKEVTEEQTGSIVNNVNIFVKGVSVDE